jgi:hypothetical protein
MLRKVGTIPKAGPCAFCLLGVEAQSRIENPYEPNLRFLRRWSLDKNWHQRLTIFVSKYAFPASRVANTAKVIHVTILSMDQESQFSAIFIFFGGKFEFGIDLAQLLDNSAKKSNFT